MAIALVANVKATPGANGGTTSSIDTTGATLLVVLISEYLGAVGFSLSDSKGNSWTGLTQKTASSVAQCRIYYTIPTSVGSGHTFTYSGAGGYPVIMVMAFSGTKATAAFDVENGATTSSGTTLQPGSVTPSENNEVVVTVVSENNGSTPTIDSGYTATDTAAAVGGTCTQGGAAYIVQTSAAATNPTWTIGASSDIAAAIATFKSDGAGGGGFSTALFRENAGLGGVGGGPFARANAGLGAIA